MKFTHMGDCHLGGWTNQELRDLNFEAFKRALDFSKKNKVDFILIAGDLFDSAYPPIETLKTTFEELKKVKESNIPVFIIAGSHDYSASGKTFLDVLESAGLCKNVARFEEHNEKIMIEPTVYKNVAIYGYPGKKSGLEVADINRIKIQDAPGLFKILMLHTVIRDAIGSLPIPSVDERKLPKVDFLALAHLHINYSKENRVYSGPTFPNNVQELEELKEGSFYLYDNGKITQHKIKLKDIVTVNLEITNTLSATKQIIDFLKSKDLKDKIIILKLEGIIENGKITDIDFKKIESLVKEKEAFTFLKSTSKLRQAESAVNLEAQNTLNLESKIIEKFIESNPNKFSELIEPIMKSLQAPRMEEEKLSIFEERLFSEFNKVIDI